MSKADCKSLLRIAKRFIKLSFYLNEFKISQPAISKFINYDNYDEFISQVNVNQLCDQIYSSCLLYVDMYNETKKGA